ncbi:MAG TPA: adenylate kinase [Firmicutes bacterium]|jgi:adenylate kinase|nr:adenylate kinase [Bacillota bacterium]
MRLVMLGPPAAGKGTQGKLLASYYGVPHISTGSMFRVNMQAQSELGGQVRQYIESGGLVPDHLAIQVVKLRLTAEDCQNGFVLDGFPRTVKQARSLHETLTELDMHLSAAVSIQIPEFESIRRILHRRVCTQCGTNSNVQAPGAVCHVCGGALEQRPDDTPETARNRLIVFRKNMEPILAFYKEVGKLITVNGLRPVQEVFETIIGRLAALGAMQQAAAGKEVAE